MNLLYHLSSPVIFAHRGASACAPENTLAAFKRAEASGVFAIELDVKLSADDVVVVIHDPTVDRTTGATGRVNQMTYADLCDLDAGIFWGEDFKGEKIPTLQNVFDLLGKRLLINIELTNYTSSKDRLVEKTLELVEKNNMQEWVLFSSFDPFN